MYQKHVFFPGLCKTSGLKVLASVSAESICSKCRDWTALLAGVVAGVSNPRDLPQTVLAHEHVMRNTVSSVIIHDLEKPNLQL